MREKIIIWCHLNDEQDYLEKIFGDDCISVRGSDSVEHKESAIYKWRDRDIPVLISKPSIYGYGMNMQFSSNMVFVGLDDSFEKFYQAVRRQYRFGQKHPVNVHIVSSDGEGAIKANIERKKQQHEEMAEEMVEHMRDLMKRHIVGAKIEKTEYHANTKMETPKWLM